MSLFLRLFWSWCLGPTLSSQVPFSINGPPLASSCIRGPSRNENLCSMCLVRVTSLVDDTCTLCVELSRLPPKRPRINHICRLYEERASLVGTTFLVLPSDPIVKSLNQALREDKIRIEHHERPIELLVASYLPHFSEGSHKRVDEISPATTEFLYHLLPIISPSQLKFLVDRCTFRQEANQGGITEESIRIWCNDGLLNLNGVLSLSYDQPLLKIQESERIEQSITHEVAILAAFGGESKTALDEGVCYPSPSIVVGSKLLDIPVEFLDRQSILQSGPHLVDCLVQARSPILLAILRSQIADPDGSDCYELEFPDHSPCNWVEPLFTFSEGDGNRNFFLTSSSCRFSILPICHAKYCIRAFPDKASATQNFPVHRYHATLFLPLKQF